MSRMDARSVIRVIREIRGSFRVLDIRESEQLTHTDARGSDLVRAKR